ncbi:MAG: bifunctional DNA primase/polymerase [Bifidobacteriaceae bacterium]|nr:bifunctional DNA primase/polymerase [Bifidobacteriaceae bacterium]
MSVDGKAVEAFREAQARPKPQAASVLARAGVPVFPCAARAKRPLTAQGFLDATCDLGQVGAWWRAHPDANIAVPTGAASGLDAVDVDRRGERSGFALFAAAQGAGVGDRWAMVVATPSGGAHYYFPACPGQPQRSWAGGAAHVDFRGEGGYVIVPPSTGAGPDGAAAGYRLVRALARVSTQSVRR